MSAKSRVETVLDRSLTVPVRGRRIIDRWSPATADTYVAVKLAARDWWDRERRAARERAHEAGLLFPETGESPAFMPWPPDRLARYVAYLVEQNKAPATISKTLAGLRAWHRVYGLPVPDGTAALVVLEDHDASLRSAGWAPQHAEPITIETAARLVAGVNRATTRGRADAAILFLTLAGMLTPAQLATLPLRAVRAHPDGLELLRAAVRGRPGADEEPVLIPHWLIDGTHDERLCPVEGILPWAAYLRGRGASERSALLRTVDRWGNVSGLDACAGQPDPDGWLDPQAFSSILARISRAAGLDGDDRPTMTELRLGGVVRRRQDGAPVDELRAASGLQTLLSYIAEAERRNAGREEGPDQ